MSGLPPIATELRTAPEDRFVPTEDTLAMSAADINDRVVSLATITQAPAGTKKAADISATFVVRTSKIAPCDHQPSRYPR
jgi:hypothetical protein